MKFLINKNINLIKEKRWDIEYHLPTESIMMFPAESIVEIFKIATISKEKRDPSENPDQQFIYVDISSIDIDTGMIINPQELVGEEAPSRARKVIYDKDIIISTVRPTRGAIALIPPELNNQICSTGFCVLKCNEDVNPYFVHFILRLNSTLEQFGKFSTGSSYPAILEEDILKTKIPFVKKELQDQVEIIMRSTYQERQNLINKANQKLKLGLNKSMDILINNQTYY